MTKRNPKSLYDESGKFTGYVPPYANHPRSDAPKEGATESEAERKRFKQIRRQFRTRGWYEF